LAQQFISAGDSCLDVFNSNKPRELNALCGSYPGGDRPRWRLSGWYSCPGLHLSQAAVILSDSCPDTPGVMPC